MALFEARGIDHVGIRYRDLRRAVATPLILSEVEGYGRRTNSIPSHAQTREAGAGLIVNRAAPRLARAGFRALRCARGRYSQAIVVPRRQ